jgi:hypothetical protein
LRWTGGNFELDFEGKTDLETTKLNTQGLLMEGLRLLDEAQRDGGGSAEPTEEPAASAHSSDTAPSSTNAPRASGSVDEEEDVLLDN